MPQLVKKRKEKQREQEKQTPRFKVLISSCLSPPKEFHPGSTPVFSIPMLLSAFYSWITFPSCSFKILHETDFANQIRRGGGLIIYSLRSKIIEYKLCDQVHNIYILRCTSIIQYFKQGHSVVQWYTQVESFAASYQPISIILDRNARFSKFS